MTSSPRLRRRLALAGALVAAGAVTGGAAAAGAATAVPSPSGAATAGPTAPAAATTGPATSGAATAGPTATAADEGTTGRTDRQGQDSLRAAEQRAQKDQRKAVRTAERQERKAARTAEQQQRKAQRLLGRAADGSARAPVPAAPDFVCDPALSHGENVSAYARSLPKGPGRGPLVSAAARSDCGRPGG